MSEQEDFTTTASPFMFVRSNQVLYIAKTNFTGELLLFGTNTHTLAFVGPNLGGDLHFA